MKQTDFQCTKQNMLDIGKSRLSAIISFIVSLLAVYASLKGLLDENLYKELIVAGSLSNFLFIGSLAQDIISIPFGLILVVLSLLFLKKPGYKIFISIIGLTGYFFYAYGLYVMQGQYTSIYLVYMAIFGLSIYSIIFGLLSFEPVEVAKTQIPGALRKSISVFLFIILLVLIPVWLLRIAPDISRHIPGEIYAVFILDLCIVFPALGIIISKLIRKKPYGNILAGVALFKAFTVCLSVAFGECFAPIYGGSQANYGNIAIFSVLTTVSLVLFIIYMLKLKKEE